MGHLAIIALSLYTNAIATDDIGREVPFKEHEVDLTFRSLLSQNISDNGQREVFCQRNWSSKIAGYVTCCRTEGTIKCLPSFIIAGVQKGGTTALSALLCTLDNISFSKKKEVHFFDNDEKFSLGLAGYLGHFRSWNLTNNDEQEPPVYGESTPFYIASREACRRISETIPDVKIIVLLRDPVSRAYSEYQMKKR